MWFLFSIGCCFFLCCSTEVQTTLVRSSWGQLFTLGLAQCAYTLSLPNILTSIINHLQANIAQEKITGNKVKIITEHFIRLQECLGSLHKLQIDAVEYAYLKALTLFSAGTTKLFKIINPFFCQTCFLQLIFHGFVFYVFKNKKCCNIFFLLQ